MNITDEDRIALSRLNLLIEELLDVQQEMGGVKLEVQPPDFTDVVQAIQGIKGPATADEIADALARKLALYQQTQQEGWGAIAGTMSEIQTALSKMNDRVIGLATRNFSGAANIPDKLDRQLGIVKSITDNVSLNALPEGTNTIGYVSPSTVRKVAEGKLFRGGGFVDTSVASPNASIHIAATTKIVYVVGFAVYADAAADITFVKNATSSGSTVASQNMNFASGTAATAVVKTGSGALSGGTEFARSRVNTQSPVVRDVFVVLPPGQSLAIRFQGPGATNRVVFNGTWFEESP